MKIELVSTPSKRGFVFVKTETGHLRFKLSHGNVELLAYRKSHYWGWRKVSPVVNPKLWDETKKWVSTYLQGSPS